MLMREPHKGGSDAVVDHHGSRKRGRARRIPRNLAHDRRRIAPVAAVRSSSALAISAARTLRAMPERRRKPRFRVLVADDVPNLRSLVRLALELHGPFEVVAEA